MNFKRILRSPFRWRQFHLLNLCLFCQMTLWGQTGFKEPSMPSPNAAAFGKYMDIPVSLHTGVPNISIPLHSVSVGTLSLPVSLSYHSSGIRVDEVASNVGLGWVLNAGGVITRTVQGKRDENNGYYTNHGAGIVDSAICEQYPNFDLNASAWNQPCYKQTFQETYVVNGVQQVRDRVRYGYWTNYTTPAGTEVCPPNGIIFTVVSYDVPPQCKQAFTSIMPDQDNEPRVDAEPDLFNFNFGGYSGKFVFDKTGKPRLIAAQDLKIEPGAVVLGRFQSWMITTPDGTRYHFGNTTGQNQNAIERSGASVEQESSTTWYLVKIESADLTHWISLEYDSEGYSYYHRGTHSITIAPANAPGPVTSFGGGGGPNCAYLYNVVDARVIRRITNSTNNVEMVFNRATTIRTDVQHSSLQTGSKAFSTIQIREGDFCKQFQLGQNYFDAAPETKVGNVNDESDKKRLKLVLVQERSCDGAITVPAYQFQYNERDLLPRRLSLARDAWGYYNGALTNDGMFPDVIEPGTNMHIAPSIADRRCDSFRMKLGVLEAIQYPTGGTTELEYEAHQENQYSTDVIGGVRIKRMTFKTGAGQIAQSKTYTYGNGNVYGGKDVYTRNNLNYALYGQQTQSYGCVAGVVYTAGQNTPLRAVQGYHIGYSYARENHSDGSSTAFRFRNVSSLSLGETFGMQQYPAVPTTYEVGGGETLAEEQLNSAGNLVKSVNYEYETIYLDTIIGKRAAQVRTSCDGTRIAFRKYFNIIHSHRLKQKTEMIDGLTTTTVHNYRTDGAHQFPIETIVTTADGNVAQTKTYYAQDMTDLPTVGAMTVGTITDATREMFLFSYKIGIPLKTETYLKGVFQGGSVVEHEAMVSGTPTNLLCTIRPKRYYAILRDGTRDLKVTVDHYTTVGMPSQITKVGFATPIQFGWDDKMRLVLRSFGTLTNRYEYLGNSGLLSKVTDENGLKTKFYYDGLQRLTKTENRMKDDGTDVQATTMYDYQYQDANNPFNLVRTTATFANVANPFVSESYLDGLGRAVGGLKKNYTPSNQHLKSTVSYDAFGRQDKAYLPFESSILGHQNAPFATPFVKTEYDASPLSRPVKQINVDNSTILTSYGTNITDEVRIFVSNNGSISSNGSYAANTLFKTTMTDENGKQTVVFKDKLGRVLLTRKFLNGQNVDTYNVYDDYGQLVAVLPPGSETNGVVNNDLTFQYKYDEKGRLMEKKIPGSEPQKFYYDARDLVVLTQDGNMRAANPQKHLATQYDALGRIERTGFLNVTPTAGQDYTTTIVISDADKLTETIYYPNKSWVQHQGARVLKPTGMNTPTDFVWSYVERRDALNYTGNPVWTGKQHLMSSSVPQRKIEDSDWQGIDWSVTGVNGAQQPTLTIRYLNGGGVSDVRTWQEFSYDNGMRMTDQKYLYALHGAGLSSPTFTLANQVYNYKDQLVEKNIGYRGLNNALQSIDYQYNTRGWLTAINQVGMGATALLTPSMQGTGSITKLAITPFLNEALQCQALEALPLMSDNNADLYSQVLTYESPDSRTQALPQKNGTISSTIWQVAGKDKQAYGFQYDELNRLTEATYFDITGSSSSPVFSSDNKFRESIGYDLRGNIVRMQRNGLNTGSWTSNGFTAATYGMIDNMVYQYGTGNRLQKVTDYSLASKGFKYTPYRGTAPDFPEDYTYDANGNLKTDRHKKILGIDYNYLNLPMVIRLEAGTLEFVYDATGVKLRKVVKNGQGVVTATYDYVNGVEYKDRILQRVAHSEGAVVRNDNGFYQHEYVLRDHLGNTRVTFRDGENRGTGEAGLSLPPDPGYDDGIITTADIVQENHYYPFGMNLEGNWNGAAGNNKYQYNGKEWNDDFGLGWNHHDWRFYDVAIGRFVTVDRLPEEEEQEQLSPYHFAYDNPIQYNDPDGQCPTCPAAVLGGAVGGLVGGLIEIGSQLYQQGEVNSWSAVAGATLQGGITGAAAGFSGGASLFTATAVGGVANGIGGAVSNTVQGKEVTASSVAKDVAIGSASALGGKLIAKVAEPTTLYRGVNESHAKYSSAAKGNAIPNKGNATPLEHNTKSTLKSPYTSWTTNKEVAKNFATRPNGNGVVLTKTLPKYRLTQSPDMKQLQLRHLPGKPIVKESEVLVRGNVRGAKVEHVTGSH